MAEGVEGGVVDVLRRDLTTRHVVVIEAGLGTSSMAQHVDALLGSEQKLFDAHWGAAARLDAEASRKRVAEQVHAVEEWERRVRAAVVIQRAMRAYIARKQVAAAAVAAAGNGDHRRQRASTRGPSGALSERRLSMVSSGSPRMPSSPSRRGTRAGGAPEALAPVASRRRASTDWGTVPPSGLPPSGAGGGADMAGGERTRLRPLRDGSNSSTVSGASEASSVSRVRSPAHAGAIRSGEPRREGAEPSGGGVQERPCMPSLPPVAATAGGGPGLSPAPEPEKLRAAYASSLYEESSPLPPPPASPASRASPYQPDPYDARRPPTARPPALLVGDALASAPRAHGAADTWHAGAAAAAPAGSATATSAAASSSTASSPHAGGTPVGGAGCLPAVRSSATHALRGPHPTAHSTSPSPPASRSPSWTMGHPGCRGGSASGNMSGAEVATRGVSGGEEGQHAARSSLSSSPAHAHSASHHRPGSPPPPLAVPRHPPLLARRPEDLPSLTPGTVLTGCGISAKRLHHMDACAPSAAAAAQPPRAPPHGPAAGSAAPPCPAPPPALRQAPADAAAASDSTPLPLDSGEPRAGSPAAAPWTAAVSGPTHGAPLAAQSHHRIRLHRPDQRGAASLDLPRPGLHEAQPAGRWLGADWSASGGAPGVPGGSFTVSGGEAPVLACPDPLAPSPAQAQPQEQQPWGAAAGPASACGNGSSLSGAQGSQASDAAGGWAWQARAPAAGRWGPGPEKWEAMRASGVRSSLELRPTTQGGRASLDAPRRAFGPPVLSQQKPQGGAAWPSLPAVAQRRDAAWELQAGAMTTSVDAPVRARCTSSMDVLAPAMAVDVSAGSVDRKPSPALRRGRAWAADGH